MIKVRKEKDKAAERPHKLKKTDIPVF